MHAMETENDPNLVEMWLQKDPVRWFAGIFGGIFAAAVSIVVSIALCSMAGMQPWFAVKVAALPFLGADALSLDHPSAIAFGLAVYLAICTFWAVIYSQFTVTTAFWARLGIGFTWGCFAWIFINNLYSKSFRDILVADVPAGGAFFVCQAYGLSLVSVGVFDKIFRKSPSR